MTWGWMSTSICSSTHWIRICLVLSWKGVHPLFTAQKQDATKLTFTSRGGRYRTVRLIYLDESQIAFNAAFSAPEEQFDGLTGLFDYLMASFLIWNDELAAKDATAYLAEGQTFAEGGEDEAAVAAFTQALLLDGSLIDAYLGPGKGQSTARQRRCCQPRSGCRHCACARERLSPLHKGHVLLHTGQHDPGPS